MFIRVQVKMLIFIKYINTLHYQQGKNEYESGFSVSFSCEITDKQQVIRDDLFLKELNQNIFVIEEKLCLCKLCGQEQLCLEFYYKDIRLNFSKLFFGVSKIRGGVERQTNELESLLYHGSLGSEPFSGCSSLKNCLEVQMFLSSDWFSSCFLSSVMFQNRSGD